ncbi:MAG: hypothetical protein KIT79_15895 [Deltaproteobacteria bacterium]|nr:hypothetical protein [Deltaproteobacteria bacterium]
MNLPEGFASVVGLLVAGIVLLVLELFVPGGVLGVAGAILLIAGSYYAFHLPVENPDLWGFGAVGVSALAASVMAAVFFRSRYARKLVLETAIGSEAKSAPSEWTALQGTEGMAQTDLRPAGVADIAGRRLDVVADCAFIQRGTRVRVKKVEGRRILVEPVSDG